MCRVEALGSCLGSFLGCLEGGVLLGLCRRSLQAPCIFLGVA